MKVPLETLLDPDATLQEEQKSFDPETLVTLRHRMIGALLKSIREKAGMSNRVFSEATEISARRVAAFQGGKRAVPLPELESMADVLGVDVNEFIDMQGPVGSWFQDQQALTALGELPQDLRAFIAEPANLPYLQLAKLLSEVPIEDLHMVARQFLEASA